MVNNINTNDITIQDMVKQVLTKLESFSPEEQYTLNSATIISDFGKIPIEQPCAIYIDLDSIIDIRLGQVIKNTLSDPNNQNELRLLTSLLNQLKKEIYYSLDNFDDNIPSKSIDELVYYAPFKTSLFTIRDTIANIEPIWLSDNIHDLNKYISIHINQYPYTFSDVLKEYLKLIISSIIQVNNISFISIPYNQLQPNIYKITFLHDLKLFLNQSHILQKIQKYDSQSFKFGLDDVILFANKRNIINKDTFEHKYNKDLQWANKELQLLGAYMNIFLTFNYMDEFPILMDDLKSQNDNQEESK